MHKIDGLHNDGGFFQKTDRDTSTHFTEEWLNAVQEELRQAIIAAGMTPYASGALEKLAGYGTQLKNAFGSTGVIDVELRKYDGTLIHTGAKMRYGWNRVAGTVTLQIPRMNASGGEAYGSESLMICGLGGTGLPDGIVPETDNNEERYIEIPALVYVDTQRPGWLGFRSGAGYINALYIGWSGGDTNATVGVLRSNVTYQLRTCVSLGEG